MMIQEFSPAQELPGLGEIALNSLTPGLQNLAHLKLQQVAARQQQQEQQKRSEQVFQLFSVLNLLSNIQCLTR